MDTSKVSEAILIAEHRACGTWNKWPRRLRLWVNVHEQFQATCSTSYQSKRCPSPCPGRVSTSSQFHIARGGQGGSKFIKIPLPHLPPWPPGTRPSHTRGHKKVRRKKTISNCIFLRLSAEQQKYVIGSSWEGRGNSANSSSRRWCDQPGFLVHLCDCNIL